MATTSSATTAAVKGLLTGLRGEGIGMDKPSEKADRLRSEGHTRRAFSPFALALVIALLLPASALGGSAVDQYSLDLPDAKGKVESPERGPVAHPSDLPPTVTAQLAHNRHGKALATIATAGELGAPPPPGAAQLTNVDVAGDEPSTLGALLSALGDPAAIGMLLALLLIGGGFAYAAYGRRAQP